MAISTPEFRAEEKYFTDQLFIECEDKFYEALDYMAEKLQRTSPDGDDIQASGGHNSSIGASKATPQLPRISLPKFSGNFVDWETFRDHFRSVVLDNAELSDIMRLHYLLSCLEGEPNDLIRTLAITDANFQVAWNILLQCYDNKRRLVHEHLHVLNTLPNITTEASELAILRDRASMAVQALHNLERPINYCSDFLVYLVSQRLDKATRKAWELQLGSTVDYPTYAALDDFLAARIRALENITPENALKSKSPKPIVQSHSTNTVKCPVCQQNHSLLACTEFKSKPITQRREVAQKLHRCFNCLGIKHSRNQCPSKHSCRTCQKRHHTLLHDDVSPSKSEVATNAPSDTKLAESPTLSSHFLSNPTEKLTGVLLATAWIRVSLPNGRFSVFRALLDQDSAITLVTERLAQRLRLTRRKLAVAISGISGASVSAKHTVQIHVTARSGNGPSYSTTALVLTSLTTYVPPRSTEVTSLPYIKGLTLADHDPTSHDGIDILIGADYGCILLNGLRRNEQNQPVAQNTIFGWILSGNTPDVTLSSQPVLIAHPCCATSELTDQICQFWEVEEFPSQTHLTDEELRCEEHFRNTHTRDSSGRYVVRLPFKQGPPIDIGESRYSALMSLQRLETRFSAQVTLADEYATFLVEYEHLGHMQPVNSSEPSLSQVVYIPHHAVFKESSFTTRVRVVFNASHKTSNGLSLNDHLMIGPKLQPDISAVLLRWRQFRYAYATDIAKMYRQIQIDPPDINYQRILWKAPHESSIKEFQLRTVTYGTASAPYLALRVLQQLAQDEGAKFPIAKPILQSHIYVDDCLFGADDKPLALQTQTQLIQLLNTAGFQLRKWASNCSELIRDIDLDDHGLASDRLFSPDEHLKILGISWNPEQDTFNFQVQIVSPLPSPPSA